MPDEFDRDDIPQRLPADSNVWTDGSLVLGKVSGVSSVGSGMYAEMRPVRNVTVMQGLLFGSWTSPDSSESGIFGLGGLSLQYRPWMQFIWVWIILTLSSMLVPCWMVLRRCGCSGAEND